MIFALQNEKLDAVIVGLEGYLHILMEELIVALPHGLEKLHILHAAVYHRAAVRRYNAVGKVEAALDGALEKRPRRFAQKARHVIRRDVHRARVRRVQADAEGVAEIHKRLGRVLAHKGDAYLPLLLRLSYELVVRLLQEVLEPVQMLQVSNC